MNYLLIFILIITTSCSSLKKKKDTEEIQGLYANKEYRPLLKSLLDNDFLNKPEDRFLKSLEIGTVYFRLKDYKNSLIFLREAKEIADQLYTVRASKKIESFLLSDSNDVYYPNPYELSLIRFYEVMSHYMLSSTGKNFTSDKEVSLSDKDVKFHRGAIESTLRDWHAYLENMAEQKLGEAVFKGTILADAMSIVMHDYLGRSTDKSKVKSFKRHGLKTLRNRMGIYKSYNRKYKNYRKDYSKLHLKTASEIDSKYVEKTYTYKETEKLFKQNSNVYVVVLRSIVNDKYGDSYDFPINLLSVAMPFSDKNNFLSFSRKVLYLSAQTQPTISFEIPTISSRTMRSTKRFKLIGNNSKIEGNVGLVANTSEVMSRLIEDESTSYKAKLGAKLAVKHLAILAAAFQTYKSLKKQGEFLAYAAGSASYAVANKSLKHFQKADIRAWHGIHGVVEMIPLSLKSGSYKLEYLGKKYDISVPKKGKKIVPIIL